MLLKLSLHLLRHQLQTMTSFSPLHSNLLRTVSKAVIASQDLKAVYLPALRVPPSLPINTFLQQPRVSVSLLNILMRVITHNNRNNHSRFSSSSADFCTFQPNYRCAADSCNSKIDRMDVSFRTC